MLLLKRCTVDWIFPESRETNCIVINLGLGKKKHEGVGTVNTNERRPRLICKNQSFGTSRFKKNERGVKSDNVDMLAQSAERKAWKERISPGKH